MSKLPNIIVFVLICLLGVSTYTTATGYISFMGIVIAWSVSVIFSIIMFVLIQMMVRQYFKQGFFKGCLPTIILYALCSLLTFSGNFNFFFTKGLESELYETELQEKRDLLNQTAADAIKALSNFEPETTETINKIESLTGQLEVQITDPARPGLGSRSQQIIREIERLLGEKLTPLMLHKNDYADLASRYRSNIDQIVDNKFKSGDYSSTSLLIKDISTKKEEQQTDIKNILDSSGIVIKDDVPDVILQTVEVINEIGTDTESFVNDPSVYSFSTTQLENSQVGTIPFALSHIFDPAYQSWSWFYGFLSVAFDWIGVAISLLWAFSKGGRDDKPVKKIKQQNSDEFKSLNDQFKQRNS